MLNPIRQMPGIGLDHVYQSASGQVFMTGIQALVRLPMMQRRLDRSHGLKTKGLVSGYRGSPLGAYDQQLWKAQKYLDANEVVFQPGLNEDLAATALWGAQMHTAFGPSDVDGVFGIWYGKGNGVDRTGDVFRNANALGTSRLGGVLAIGGDDHAAQSSMFPHQTDGIFQSVMMPVIQPANVSEILSLGLAGFALSRFSGLWVAMKSIAEVVESAATFDLPNPDPKFIAPAELVPPHGLNWDPGISWPAQRQEYERRMVEERIPAAIGWATANKLDKPIISTDRKALCVVSVGKAHQDVMQALRNLRIGTKEAEALGLSVYKVAMTWPLATGPLIAFCRDFETVLIVEEKAGTVEDQLKAALYGKAGRQPAIIGKRNQRGETILPATLEFSPAMVAQVIAQHLPGREGIDLQVRLQSACAEIAADDYGAFPVRKPFFCSGCPHNSSTKTPEGSITGGGIGCHVMALSLPKLKTSTFSHMGGEGVQWVGAAPFSKTSHIFQNIGDGTYQHSGLLAVRAAVAAGTNITYKILFNDAVAMTGGQPAEGVLDPAVITHQLAAEGVGKIWLVSDEPEKWRNSSRLAAAVKIGHRDEIQQIQAELREVAGVTAIVYDQTCAAEKRRRRKRKSFPDPARRVFINSRVCEGCGDCSAQSNCISIEPLETEFGTKRRINQSSCNKDFSCIKGFCPSFVEIDGYALRKPDHSKIQSLESELFAALPDVDYPDMDDACNVYIAGIGGLGVLTVGSLLGSAAYIDGKASTVLDFTGLAQKNGAVVSQVRLAEDEKQLHAVRIGKGEADLLLGTDLVVSASADVRSKLSANRSRALINSEVVPTADIVTDRDTKLPTDNMIAALGRATGDKIEIVDATKLAEGLFGNNVAANTLMLGFAWQRGLLPVSIEALREAIKANGAAVELNLRALEWGRLAAVDPGKARSVAGIAQQSNPAAALQVSAKQFEQELVDYQNEAYAEIYRDIVARAEQAADGLGQAGQQFIDAVTRNAYKVMAYKDEYEVARLYSLPSFRQSLEAQFSSAQRISLWLAPPMISRIDPATGRPKKRKFGPWVFTAFSLLRRLKGLRGTALDLFGRTAERKAERALRDTYLATIEDLCDKLDKSNIDAALKIASLPEEVRGFGPVKEEAICNFHARLAELTAGEDQPAIAIAA